MKKRTMEQKTFCPGIDYLIAVAPDGECRIVPRGHQADELSVIGGFHT